MKNIAIIGSGSWGVALAIHLANKGNNVKIWSFAEEEKNLINEEKKCKFLPNVELPENIYCSQDFEEVLNDADLILHVTPSKFTRTIFKQYKEFVGNTPVIICSKGFEKESLNSQANQLTKKNEKCIIFKNGGRNENNKRFGKS